MRLTRSNAAPRVPGSKPGQILLARALAVRGEGGMKAALWPLMHLLGAVVFVIVMLARMAQADTAPLHAPAFDAAGPATFPHLEWRLPSAPNLN